MKKLITFIIVLTCVLSLAACSGRTNNVKMRDVDSELYSQEEITDAINVIKKEFESDTWKGCILTEIYYAGDEISKEYQGFADRNNADEVMVLLSTFKVGLFGGDGSLNTNCTYDEWNWILVRGNDGKWEHVDHGY